MSHDEKPMPRIIYPCHYFNFYTDIDGLTEFLKTDNKFCTTLRTNSNPVEASGASKGTNVFCGSKKHEVFLFVMNHTEHENCQHEPDTFLQYQPFLHTKSIPGEGMAYILLVKTCEFDSRENLNRHVKNATLKLVSKLHSYFDLCAQARALEEFADMNPFEFGKRLQEGALDPLFSSLK